ncbi:MAG: outer membrane lipoprotein-sorting protein [Candidatus Hatepunaea meridiana]|nr:outer membrane lipoprotein-sorting protein [Candidatus Hatepunaea meridiana]
MKTLNNLTIILIVLFIGANFSSGEEFTAKQIVDKSYNATKLAGSEATSTMTIIDKKGRERVRKIAQVTKLYDNGDTEKKLIRFLAPADVKGTGMLTFDYEVKDDDIWLYMPALRKTRRIVSSEKAKSFMGSEFSYADMTPPNLDEFSFKLLGEPEVNGTLCWQIEMTPNDDDIADENGFSKKISFIGKEDYIIRKAVYYDLDESLLKELTVKEIMLLDAKNKKYRPIEMEMVNVQNDRRSILKIDKILFNPNVKDEFFTTRYLERE